MYKINSQQIIKNADLEKISEFFAARKEKIFYLITEELKAHPATPYIHHILKHPEGRRRNRRFLDCSF